MNKVKFPGSFSRQNKLRTIAVWSVIVLILALLLFFVLKNSLETNDLQAAYEKALKQADFGEIIALHGQAQKIIADTTVSEAKSADLADAILVRSKIESQLSTFAQTTIESVMLGNSLTEEEADKLSLSMSIVGDSSLDMLEDALKDYVLDSISEADTVQDIIL